MEKEITSDEVQHEITEPIIIHLGKQRRKRIKGLLKGRGKLIREVDDVVEEVSSLLGEELDGKVIVPLILIYKEKPRKRGMFGR